MFEVEEEYGRTIEDSMTKLMTGLIIVSEEYLVLMSHLQVETVVSTSEGAQGSEGEEVIKMTVTANSRPRG